MQIRRIRSTFFPLVFAIAFASGIQPRLYAQGEVQRQHDADQKNQNNANTKYHNNADDYPVNTVSPVAPVKTGIKPAEPIRIEDPRQKEFDKFRVAYQAGDADAGLAFGNLFYYGSVGGVSKDTALEIWLKVADRNAKARFLAGKMIYNGEATAMDEARGLTMIRSAAQSGDTEASAYLLALPVHAVSTAGEFPSMATRIDDYLHTSMAPSANPGLDKFRKAAVQSVERQSKKVTASDYEVAAVVYLHGMGVPVDLAKAEEYLLTSKKMSDPRYTHSQDANLTWLYLMQREKNPAAFIKQAMVTGRANPWPDNLYMMAIAASMDHNPTWQRSYLEQAITHQTSSDKAPIEAYLELGVMQLTAEGGVLDEAQGMKNLLAAGANRNAQYMISKIMANGTHGQIKDPAKARLWLEAAAKAGQPDAVRELAVSSAH